MQYRSLLPTLSLSAALLCSATPAPAAEKFQQAQDMRYGAVLYDYFQGNYFDALSSLMVAEERGESLAVHADNAALIQGGISLGFGLQQRAADLFEQQLQVAADGEDSETIARYRTLAWLKLAELNYLRQEWPLAAQQLQQSGTRDSTGLAVNLALRNGELARAAELLDGDALPLPQRILGRSNLAAALAREQRYAEATEHYRQAAALAERHCDSADEPSQTEQTLCILRDKAYIGAGYSLGLQQRYAEALSEFRRVRLHTAWADRALLGLAWAAVNSGDYAVATDALRFLLSSAPDSPAAWEAQVVLPYSYEKLQRPTLALGAYLSAEQHYQDSLQELQQLHQAVRAQEFAPAGDADAQRYGWLQIAAAPQLMQDNQRYLQRILQSNRFQLRLAELRDLKQLSGVIARWQERLPLFSQLIAARGQRREEIVERYQSAQFDQQVEFAERRYRDLSASLARIREQRDYLALVRDGSADGELLQMLERAEGRHAQLAPLGKTRPRQTQTLQRARGLLLWQASEQYHHNLWQQQKALDALGGELEDAAQQRTEVDLIAQRAPQLQQLQQKVRASAPQLAARQAAIDAASAQIEAEIRRDVMQELTSASTQIQQYLAHSRLAIARLQDAAMQAAPVQAAAPNPESNEPPADTGAAPENMEILDSENSRTESTAGDAGESADD